MSKRPANVMRSTTLYYLFWLCLTIFGLLLTLGDISSDGKRKPPMESNLVRTLGRLMKRRERPSEMDWKQFRKTCKQRKRYEECAEIFDYFRTVLIPLQFPKRSRRYGEFDALFGGGLSKPSSEPAFFFNLQTVMQFGDDASLLGQDYAIVSDGITRDPDSDFFAQMVVEFLGAVMPRLDRTDDLGDQLYEATCALEELIVEVRLPGAATLSIALLSPDNEYLYVATLGDSEVKVFRDGKLRYRSPMQRKGNKPGQLNSGIPRAVDKMTIERVRVSKGDMVVMASDGLWDNVLETHAGHVLEKSSTVQDAVFHLMRLAMEGKYAVNKECGSTDDHEIERCVGARKDDITIIVGNI